MVMQYLVPGAVSELIDITQVLLCEPDGLGSEERIPTVFETVLQFGGVALVNARSLGLEGIIDDEIL